MFNVKISSLAGLHHKSFIFSRSVYALFTLQAFSSRWVAVLFTLDWHYLDSGSPSKRFRGGQQKPVGKLTIGLKWCSVIKALATIPSPRRSTVQELFVSLFSSPNQQWASSWCTSPACGWKTTVMQQFCLGFNKPLSGLSWNGGWHSHWKNVWSLLCMQTSWEGKKKRKE